VLSNFSSRLPATPSQLCSRRMRPPALSLARDPWRQRRRCIKREEGASQAYEQLCDLFIGRRNQLSSSASCVALGCLRIFLLRRLFNKCQLMICCQCGQ